jgi:hypothetical protein
MTMRKGLLAAAAASLAFAAGGEGALAATYSYVFSNEFSGGTPPDGTPPWATLSFSDVVGGVQLSLSLMGLVAPESVKGFYFNFGANPGDATTASRLGGLTFTHTGGDAATSIDRGGSTPLLNQYKADGDGYFDIRFNFPSGGGFNAGEQSVYLISGSSVSAADFNSQSLTGGGNGIWYAAMHVQNTGTGNGGSGWVGATVSPIPEPQTYAMLLAGITLLTVFGLRRDRRALAAA